MLQKKRKLGKRNQKIEGESGKDGEEVKAALANESPSPRAQSPSNGIEKLSLKGKVGIRSRRLHI